jgi:RNA polymerase sigma-70 factor (ECF subfamily)
MIDADARCAHRELEGRLRPFVARRVSASDGDAVLQDAFLGMQRDLKNLREEDRFGPWVYQEAQSAAARRPVSLGRLPASFGHAPRLQE